MNDHRRREAKAARRRRRLEAETPGQREYREGRNANMVNAGAARMFGTVVNPTEAERKKNAAKRAKPTRMVPIPCRCDHGNHDAHWVEASRLQKGGDLRGKVKLDAVARELLEAA